MTKFNQIKLELVRPGPSHNQLLSPLTRYMALCGESSPITFNIQLEHHQLLSRLERLRYVTPDRKGAPIAVPENMREATVLEVSKDVEQIIGNFRSMLGETWKAIGSATSAADAKEEHFVNVRLVVSGSELSYIPFELATVPDSFPGEGREWLLDSQMPVVLTREIRRSRSVPVSWDQGNPKILVISASPTGDVPLKEHITAIRSALEPWIHWPKPEDLENNPVSEHEQRLEFVMEHLRVLPDASVESIHEICSKEKFTHIHILAHGGHMDTAGERRYGLVLCKENNPGQPDVVSGKRLAESLQAKGASGAARSAPTLVTMATCDAGNQGSVLVPGASIAHDLHVAGIPWVIASQFPLTKVGSIRMTRTLYPLLLRGDDPRYVLFEVRRKLHMSATNDHDWASIVVYASIPNDFEDHVYNFFEKQTRARIWAALQRADEIKKPDDEVWKKKRKIALETAEDTLAIWERHIPDDKSVKARTRQTEYHGMCGSTYKRIALQYYERGEIEEGQKKLERSLASYLLGVEEWTGEQSKYHWVATQALSLRAVLKKGPDQALLLIAFQLAERDLEANSKTEQAWAHGTLAELEMIAYYHNSTRLDKPAMEAVKRKVQKHCKEIVKLSGEDLFPVESTRRQFKRYLDFWQRPQWNDVADAAVTALTIKPNA